MDVPWQCPRCSLHNVSATCSACAGPRPAHLDDLPAMGEGAEPPAGAVPQPEGAHARGDGRGVRVGAAARPWPAAPGTPRAHSPDAAFPPPPGFNPAEAPQEFTGIGQQAPPQAQEGIRVPGLFAINGEARFALTLPPCDSSPSAPAGETAQQMSSQFASFGQCAPFVILLSVLFLFRHIFGVCSLPLLRPLSLTPRSIPCVLPQGFSCFCPPSTRMRSYRPRLRRKSSARCVPGAGVCVSGFWPCVSFLFVAAVRLRCCLQVLCCAVVCVFACCLCLSDPYLPCGGCVLRRPCASMCWCCLAPFPLLAACW